MNAFLTITGIETLHLRMERHVANALKVAEFLFRSPACRLGFLRRTGGEPVSTTSPGNTCRGGAGAVFTFGVKGGYEAGTKARRKTSSCSPTSPISATPAA